MFKKLLHLQCLDNDQLRFLRLFARKSILCYLLPWGPTKLTFSYWHSITPLNLEVPKGNSIGKRTIVRAVSNTLGIWHLCVYKLMKSRLIGSQKNSTKTKLSIERKHKWFNFILSQVIPPSTHTIPRFSLIYNVVYTCEKWFYMCNETQRF